MTATKESGVDKRETAPAAWRTITLALGLLAMIGLLGAVGVNAGLNVLLIPQWRELGAAWATVATNVVLGALVLRESHRQFRIPFEVGRLARIVLAAIAVLLAADRSASLSWAVGTPLRLLLVLLFPVLLVPARALSARELRALPRVAREMMSRRQP